MKLLLVSVIFLAISVLSFLGVFGGDKTTIVYISLAVGLILLTVFWLRKGHILEFKSGRETISSGVTKLKESEILSFGESLQKAKLELGKL